MTTTNTNSINPHCAFDFRLMYQGKKVAEFQDFTLIVKSQPFNLEYSLEDGLLDINFFKKYGLTPNAEQELKLDIEFSIEFDTVSLHSINSEDFLFPAQEVNGTYSIGKVKVDSSSLGIMPSRHIAAKQFKGTASLINFIPSS